MSTSTALVEGHAPASGSLGIRDRRAWKTWQLCGLAALMFLFGLYIESLSHVKPLAAASSTFKLPPNSESAGSPTSSTTAPLSGSQPAGTGATSTTLASGASPSGVTPTTAAGSAPASAPAAGQVAIVLIPRYPASGGATGTWTSPSFTVTSAPWNIGWAYACAGSNPSFTVTVGPGTTSAVSGTSPSGQGVTPQSTTGTFTITATGSAGCQWVVKVTGIGTPAG